MRGGAASSGNPCDLFQFFGQLLASFLFCRHSSELSRRLLSAASIPRLTLMKHGEDPFARRLYWVSVSSGFRSKRALTILAATSDFWLGVHPLP